MANVILKKLNQKIQEVSTDLWIDYGYKHFIAVRRLQRVGSGISTLCDQEIWFDLLTGKFLLVGEDLRTSTSYREVGRAVAERLQEAIEATCSQDEGCYVHFFEKSGELEVTHSEWREDHGEDGMWIDTTKWEISGVDSMFKLLSKYNLSSEEIAERIFSVIK